MHERPARPHKVDLHLDPHLSRTRGLIVLAGFEEDRSAPRPAKATKLPKRKQAQAEALAEATRDAAQGWRGERSAFCEGRLGGSGVVRLDGLGARESFDQDALESWVKETINRCRSLGFGALTLALPTHRTLAGALGARRVVTAIHRALYQFESFREQADSSPGKSLREIHVVASQRHTAAYKSEWRHALALARGIDACRDLGNTPPNIATPEWIAAQARSMAKTHGLEATVLTPSQLEKRGMGGILAVGQGATNGPRMVRLRVGRRGPKVALIGKGITFDTGGISIKPSASMEEMKYDKCGACTVFGIAQAVAESKLGIRLSAYLALAENMPDGNAYRPSDIITTLSGKTVEIHNTDAEGRMVLADALAWASRDEPGLPGGLRHAHRCLRSRPRRGSRRSLRPRRAPRCGVAQGRRRRQRKTLAHAAVARVRRADEGGARGPQKLRQPMGRREHGGGVPFSIHRTPALGTP